MLVIMDIRFFFFFQAEDGIRDVAVTGVQTCALPICLGEFGSCSKQEVRMKGKLVSVLPLFFVVLASAVPAPAQQTDRKSTRLNSSHGYISYAVFCLKKKNKREVSNYSPFCSSPRRRR